MDSRRTLWAGLVLGAAPFLLEATAGCDVVLGLQRPTHPNALYCECSCDAGGGGLRNVLVARGEDDAEEVGGTMDLTNGDLDLGNALVGVRFENLVIPQGATIQHAYVQFVGDADGETEPTTYQIRAEASTTAGSFTSATNDLSGRITGMFQVDWAPGPWNNGDAGPGQRTEDIAPLLQELVSDPAWNDASAIVLRFEGTGHRSAESFEGSDQAPLLIVEVGAAVAAILPVCASADSLSDDVLSPGELIDECARVQATLTGLAAACSYPQPCMCDLVDQKDPSGGDRPDSVEADSCTASCDEMEVDAPACTSFDPNAFSSCLAEAGATIESCKHHVSATNAGDDSPVCVASGSALAFHAFGERSQCEVEGVSDIRVGDRRPKNDPVTAGVIEILGGPCLGASCPVHPSFGLRMNDIEFEVRWASNPVFGDLGAVGRGLETAAVDPAGDAVFASDAVFGTGAGRRGSKALAIDATNPDPLGLGVSWAARTCYLDGALAVGVGDDGACEADPAIPCATDDDCAGVGGACLLAPPTDEMLIDVLLEGALVNQPPRAAAGPDQSIECTSSAGESFVLDGRGSGDPDHNLALVSWRQGTRTGLLLSNDLVLALSLGVGESESYVLRAVDGFAQTDEDVTQVAVVDTTPPELSIAVSPTTLWPPNHKFVPITVSASTSDICDTSPEIRLLSITSNELANGTGDGSSAADVQGASFGQDDREFLLRAERSGNGGGRIYTITYEAVDDGGNASLREATVTVPHQH